MPTATRTDFGNVADGTVERVRLETDGLAAEFLTIGAAVHRVIVDGRDVALGHPDAAGYAPSAFCVGLTIGRFANRIGGARFSVDGTTYVLPANEGVNTLHGGPNGFAHRLWTIAELTDSSVTFTLESADGDQGFPGLVLVTVRYGLAPDEVRIDYSADTTGPTPVSLTNHIYFNPAGEASGPADDLVLTVHAAERLEVDEGLIPTGRRLPVHPHDLQDGCRVAEAAPLDTCFVINGEPGTLRPHATLACADLAIDVLSDQPGLQVYTADVMDRVPGLSGVYGPRAGVALETQNFPDAPNQPDFPDPFVRPGRPYSSTTIWRFRTLG